MSDSPEENQELEQEEQEGPEMADELTLLKQRADTMGLTYHPNIGVEKLKERIAAKLAPPEEPAEQPGAKDEAETIAAAMEAKAGMKVAAGAYPTPQQQKMARRDKALRLVRVRVTNMNPIKGNLKGELLSAGNSEIGMVKRFIPFNTEQGWHVPQILLTLMQAKKFMSHYEVKIGNKRIKKNKLVPEYSIEIMEPLTAKELEELKQRQLMAAGQ